MGGIGAKRKSKPKIDLKGFILTPDRIHPNGHTKANDIATLERADPETDPEIARRRADLAAEKRQTEALPTESPEEMLRRIHAERAQREREDTRRERQEAMGRPAPSPLPARPQTEPRPAEPPSPFPPTAGQADPVPLAATAVPPAPEAMPTAVVTGLSRIPIGTPLEFTPAPPLLCGLRRRNKEQAQTGCRNRRRSRDPRHRRGARRPQEPRRT